MNIAQTMLSQRTGFPKLVGRGAAVTEGAQSPLRQLLLKIDYRIQNTAQLASSSDSYSNRHIIFRKLIYPIFDAPIGAKIAIPEVSSNTQGLLFRKVACSTCGLP
jgi:hypothetical protein